MSESKGFYKEPSEVDKINAEIDRHQEIRWWEKRLQISAWVFYGVAAALWIIRGSSEGMALIWLMVLVLFLASVVVGFFESRKRHEVRKMINAYKRKNAVPLYHEMLEKFADHPNLHIHLADDGTIVINDRSKEKKS